MFFYFFFLLCQNSMPTLSQIQLGHGQFRQRFMCVMLAGANVAWSFLHIKHLETSGVKWLCGVQTMFWRCWFPIVNIVLFNTHFFCILNAFTCMIKGKFCVFVWHSCSGCFVLHFFLSSFSVRCVRYISHTEINTKSSNKMNCSNLHEES